MIDLIIYLPEIKAVSGVTTFAKNLFAVAEQEGLNAKILYDRKYDDIFAPQITIKNTQQILRAKKLVFASLFIGKHNVQAHQNILVIHTPLHKFNLTLPKNERIDEYVCVSQEVADDLSKYYDVKKTVRVIPNPVHSNGVIASSMIRFATFTRLFAYKGLEYIEPFIERNLKKLPMVWQWEFFTDYYQVNQANKYRQLLSGLFAKYPENIVLRHSVTNPAPHILNSNYIVHLSEVEGFGYVVHESLSLGRPVIVFDLPVYKGVVKHGKNGYIVDKETLTVDVNDLIYESLNVVYKPLGGYRQWAGLLTT